VLALNRQAFAHLACEKRLELIAGATHLFEEPGALEQVAALAGDWLVQHLPGRG
jgi:putative phosphoribosyl transferase